MNSLRVKLVSVILAISLLAIGQSADAHAPWVTIEDGKVTFFFGENPAERDYKLPPPVAAAKVTLLDSDGTAKPIEMKSVEQDDFVGMTSSQSVEPGSSVISKVTYGIYNGSRLDYFALHRGGKLPTSRKAYEQANTKLGMSAQMVDTQQGVDVFIIANGKPLAGAEVKLFCDEGHEEANGTTDENGKVSFNDNEVEDGLNGISVVHAVQEAGELGGDEYKSTLNYLTATFFDPQDFE